MNTDHSLNDIRLTRTRSGTRPTSVSQQFNSVRLQQTWPNNLTPVFEPRSTSRIFAPIVTAHAWSIHDLKTGEMLWEKRSTEQREMASLTKIMTCLLSCQLLDRFQQDPEKLTFTVTKFAARICGTHSGLRENEVVRVIDLLYGLMLPSGNDCAIVLAHGFGEMLLKSKKSRVIDRLPVNPVSEFVKEMNKVVMKLGLRSTSFTNPHGLSEKGNRSTAADLGKIAYNAMEIPLIQKVSSTQSYEAEVVDSKGQTRTLNWKNTNKLLEKGFEGLKTGTTPNAGLCLSSVLRQGDNGVIVTLLSAKTEAHRWNESEKLARWALSTMSYVKDKMESEFVKSKITAKLLADISRNL